MTYPDRVSLALPALALLALACGPRYPDCERDGDCRQGEICVNGRCQQCRDDGDCPAGMACEAGACRDIGRCEGVADCAPGQVCRDHRCGPCRSDGDCGEDLVCLDGLCAMPECRADDQCPAGLSCVGHRCVSTSSPTAAAATGCDMESVYFAFDSAEVSSEMRRRLEGNYQCLSEVGGRVTLEGHCDPRGTTEYNMALGDRRARMARKLLRRMGADVSDLRVVSKGEEEAAGRDEATWSEDRRVDFE